MSAAQRIGLGLFMLRWRVGCSLRSFRASSGQSACPLYQRDDASFLILILVFAVYGLFRTAVSVLRELNGVPRAAHATLHADYGKK